MAKQKKKPPKGTAIDAVPVLYTLDETGMPVGVLRFFCDTGCRSRSPHRHPDCENYGLVKRDDVPAGAKCGLCKRQLKVAWPKGLVPSVRYDFYVNDIGYQVDVLVDGEDVGSQCRDFAGSYEDEAFDGLLNDLNRRIRAAIDAWRSAH